MLEFEISELCNWCLFFGTVEVAVFFKGIIKFTIDLEMNAQGAGMNAGKDKVSSGNKESFFSVRM
jgi:hypothetical protein